MRAPRPALPKKKGLPTSPSGPGGVKSESHSCHVFKGAFTLVYLHFSHSPDSLDGKLKSRAEKGLAPILHIILGGRSGPPVSKRAYVNPSKCPPSPTPPTPLTPAPGFQIWVAFCTGAAPGTLFRAFPLEIVAFPSTPVRRISSFGCPRDGVRSVMGPQEREPPQQSSPSFPTPPPPHTVPGMRETTL